jgi:iron complex outermembrane receptor protein
VTTVDELPHLPWRSFARTALVAGFAAVSSSNVAMAQSTGTVGVALEEIVVTAQKRSQRLEDVPVAVTAVSSEEIERRGITQMTDLTRVAPSLTITEQSSATNNSINLRGIGTYAFSIGVESAVAVIVDDIPLLQQAQAFSSLADIERIEVLRGPQGTLFGKNASAGVVNIVTKPPSDGFTGAVSLSATSDDQYRVQSSVSGPLGDRVGARLSAFYDDRDGYIRNLDTGHDLNGERSYGFRGRGDFTVLDNLELSLMGSHTVKDVEGTIRTFRKVPPTAVVFGVPIGPTLVGIDPGDDNYKVRVNREPSGSDRQSLGSLRATLDLDTVDLISITGYQDWEFAFVEDFDSTNLVAVDATAPFHGTMLTQELRLVSEAGPRFEYLAGLFYSDGETKRTFQRGPLAVANWAAESRTKSSAFFAQGTFHLTPTTHIDAGIRFNTQDIHVSFTNFAAAGAPTFTGDDSEDATTYKLALRQDLVEGVMAYVSYATGYKGEGYDVSTGFTQSRADNPVKNEDSKAYEVGLKSRFWDGRAQLNLAGFLTDYENFQAQSFQFLADGTAQLMLANVGKLRTKGVELELSALPFENLRIDVGAAYTDATIESFPNAQCYTGQTVAQGCVPITGTTTAQDLSGKSLSNSPKVKYSVAANYDIQLPTSFNGFVAADYQHQSKVNFDLTGNPANAHPAYGVANLSMGIKEAADERYRVALFVNNVFDKHYAAYLVGVIGGPAGSSSQVLPRNSERYYGVRASYKF